MALVKMPWHPAVGSSPRRNWRDPRVLQDVSDDVRTLRLMGNSETLVDEAVSSRGKAVGELLA